jgi:NhaA family Na+:H+ antiporter
MLLRFIKVERNAAALLVLAAITGLVLANLPGVELSIHSLAEISEYSLMLFFFLVGLELKRELTDGAFKEKKKLIVPLMAAVSGALLPALLYFAVTNENSVAQSGWAIPMATDITFALAIFSFFANRMPSGSRQFLLAFAIIDDILAIIVIALFLGVPVLTGALVTGSAVFGLLVPVRFISKLENVIHPFVAYLVLPIFAFTALAIPISQSLITVVGSVVGLGVLLRVIGKVIGISFGAWLGSKIAGPVSSLRFIDYLKISVLGGIGFTVSFLVTNLVFADYALERAQAIVASLIAALIAIVLSTIVFRYKSPSLG